MSQPPQAKKLISVLATSSSMIAASREDLKVRVQDRLPYICYPVQFHKDKSKDILALLNFRSEINAMTPA